MCVLVTVMKGSKAKKQRTDPGELRTQDKVSVAGQTLFHREKRWRWAGMSETQRKEGEMHSRRKREAFTAGLGWGLLVLPRCAQSMARLV